MTPVWRALPHGARHTPVTAPNTRTTGTSHPEIATAPHNDTKGHAA